MKNLVRCTALFGVLLLLACGISGPTPQAECLGQNQVIGALEVRPGGPATRGDPDAGAWDIPLSISMTVDCLRGGIQVSANATEGHFVGGTPATAFVVSLAPLGDGTVGGRADLLLPPDTMARIEITADSAIASSTVEVSDAGLVTFDGGTTQLF